MCAHVDFRIYTHIELCIYHKNMSKYLFEKIYFTYKFV
jgi:hypothetical protein